MLQTRVADHRSYVSNRRTDKATGAHFNMPGHSLADLRVSIIEQTRRKSLEYRKEREHYHIRKFNTKGIWGWVTVSHSLGPPPGLWISSSHSRMAWRKFILLQTIFGWRRCKFTEIIVRLCFCLSELLKVEVVRSHSCAIFLRICSNFYFPVQTGKISTYFFFFFGTIWQYSSKFYEFLYYIRPLPLRKILLHKRIHV